METLFFDISKCQHDLEMCFYCSSVLYLHKKQPYGWGDIIVDFDLKIKSNKQVAQWEFAQLGASIMFGDTIIYESQKQVTT